jgi:hypothetical protein
MRLALIVGHTEAKQGANAIHPISRSEYTLWSELAIEMWREAREMDIECQVFKKDGLSNEAVASAVNAYAENRRCLAVELHFNSFADQAAKGCETLYISGNEASKSWANTLQKNQIKALTEPNPLYSEFRKDATNPFKKPKDRGLKALVDGDRGYGNLVHVKPPVALVEGFFGSNRDDCERFWRCKAKYCRTIPHSAIEHWLLTAKM